MIVKRLRIDINISEEESDMDNERYVYQTPASKLVQIAAIAREFRDQPDQLMHVMIKCQQILPALSEAAAKVIAREMNVPLNKVYGFITFYAMFSVKPRGRYIIHMCKSAPCHVKGAQEIVDTLEQMLGIKVGETTEDGRFTLEYCPCIGLCEFSPAIMINDKAYSNLTPESTRDIIRQYIRGEIDNE